VIELGLTFGLPSSCHRFGLFKVLGSSGTYSFSRSSDSSFLEALSYGQHVQSLLAHQAVWLRKISALNECGIHSGTLWTALLFNQNFFK
jgi:hypothetical protein